MTCSLTCSTCGEIMGTLDKPEITDEDRALWSAQVNCSLNHETTILVQMSEEERSNYQSFLEANVAQKAGLADIEAIPTFNAYLDSKDAIDKVIGEIPQDALALAKAGASQDDIDAAAAAGVDSQADPIQP